MLFLSTSFVVLLVVFAFAVATAAMPCATVHHLHPDFEALIEKGAAVETVAEGLSWAEGPTWVDIQLPLTMDTGSSEATDAATDQSGFLLFSDVINNTMYRVVGGSGDKIPFAAPSGCDVGRNGEHCATLKEPGSNGLLWDRFAPDDPALLICEHGARRVSVLPSSAFILAPVVCSGQTEPPQKNVVDKAPKIRDPGKQPATPRLRKVVRKDKEVAETGKSSVPQGTSTPPTPGPEPAALTTSGAATTAAPMVSTARLIADKVRQTVARSKARAARGDPIKIALLVPTTTAGTYTQIYGVEDLPMINILLPSVLRSTDPTRCPHQPRLHISFYIGFDKGDPFYDPPVYAYSDTDEDSTSTDTGATTRTKAARNLARLVTTFQRLTARYQSADAGAAEAVKIDMNLLRARGSRGAPCWLWNALAGRAVEEGADYLYQINDDLELVTPCWAEHFIRTLQAATPVPNLGIVGPLDSGNAQIMTQSFVHRTHLDIFSTYYPIMFKNWYSDNWASRAYGLRLSRHETSYVVRNRQSLGTRYTVAHSSWKFLDPQLHAARDRLRGVLVELGAAADENKNQSETASNSSNEADDDDGKKKGSD